MNLRNKRTGEIRKVHSGSITIFLEDEKNPHDPDFIRYNSLKELNEEWGDYEEPEEDFWYIDSDCETYGVSRAFNQNDSDDVLFNKSIGNYFESKEEAERAVEKLKAWKRLKDKGLRFIGKTYETDKRFGSAFYKLDEDTYSEDVVDDIDLLFGGEE